jgi:predicted ATPase/transcriptional regulator with XRE-family HTH domain
MGQDASFGGWLARRRLSLGLSRAALAQRAGCAAITLRKIEEDARRPSPELAAKLAEHVGMGSDERERFVQVARGIRTVAWLPPAEQEAATGALAPEMSPAELPAPATRLIGRSSELATLGSLLRGEDARLLVVTGPGGVGKTRLALQAAAAQRSAFRDGVAFVALAPLRDAALVVPTIAQALRLHERGGRTLLELLIDYLRPRHLLLVLDNFEHVAPAGQAVAALLASAPQLKLLITSRSVLHLYGEHDVVVRPLALPSASLRSALEQTRQSEAIQLFTERAQAAAAFAVTAENAHVLAGICRRLDGLPLALELVAPWTRVLPLTVIAERLTGVAPDARLHFAGGGPQNLPDRQRSLRATIDWSYQLLTGEERILLRRLAVLVGGCTLATAEAVLGGTSEPDACAGQEVLTELSIGDVLGGLASLVDKSLLMSANDGGAARFTMLETVREYALEQLVQPEADEMRRRLATYCLRTLETIPPGTAWLNRVADEYDNMRAALAWALAHKESGLSLALGQRLEWFWFARGSISEGREWLERVLTAVEATSNTTPALAVIGRMAGYFAYFQSDYARATTLFAASLATFRALGDQAETANLLINHGMVAEAQGDMVLARAYFEESLHLRQMLGDRDGIADSRYHLGRLALFEGDHARASELLEESLALFREVGHDYIVPIVLGFLGYTRLARLEPQQAIDCFREAIGMLQVQGNMFMVPYQLVGLAGALSAQGHYTRAAEMIGVAEALTAETGLRPSPGERAIWDATITTVRGQLGEEVYQAALSVGRALTLEQIIVQGMQDQGG